MDPANNSWSRRTFLALGASAIATSCASTKHTGGEALYIDGLSFLPDDPEDIARSRLDAFICDVSGVETVKDDHGLVSFRRTFVACDTALDEACQRIETEFPDAWTATRGSQIMSHDGTAVFLQFQSCEPIEDKLERIAYFYDKGLRILQLTHHHDNLFAGGALESTPSGLTALGREGVAEMNRLGLLPDLSHGSDQTTLETAAASTGPVIVSHGACRALVDNPRCTSDAAIRAIADSGGAMGIFMMSFWLTTDRQPEIGHLVEHIRHVVKVGGIDAAAIANDYSVSGHETFKAIGNDNEKGMKGYHEWWRSIRAKGVPGYETLPQHAVIPDLNNVYRMETIHRALESRGFRAAEIDKIMGENWHRVLTTVLG